MATNEQSPSAGVRKKRKRVGRGIGSGLGKTSGRGAKGAKSRSGYKRRIGNEGGNIPSYQKYPKRGFTRGRFVKDHFVINLDRIDELYSDGETINRVTLREKGYIKSQSGTLKVLGRGELTKKVRIECDALSKSAKEKFEAQGISYQLS